MVDPKGDDSILEMKHSADALLVCKTRGTFTIAPGGPMPEPIIARAGHRLETPCDDPAAEAAGWERVFREAAADFWSPLATGFVILGVCIGLLIGTAQVVLKEAWLKIESGRRAGREVLLTKPSITIGRAESCDIGLFGDAAVERMHARILLQGNRYLLADEDTPAGTYLNDERIDGPAPLSSGDVIRVGNCTLRFGERQKRLA